MDKMNNQAMTPETERKPQSKTKHHGKLKR
jgi:hypothetical protein